MLWNMIVLVECIMVLLVVLGMCVKFMGVYEMMNVGGSSKRDRGGGKVVV